MALIEPNTLVSFIWGAHFYNTQHDGSDFDIVSVIMPTIDNVFAGINYKAKQKHDVEWLGNKVDITRYSLSHFIKLIGSGNIQLIELVLKYDPQYTIYYSDTWNAWHTDFRHYAFMSLKKTKWGHIRGWLHKTMKKADLHGMNVKRAMLISRMVIEAQHYMKTGKLICKWPEIIELAPAIYRPGLHHLYHARRTGEGLSEKFMIDLGLLLEDEVRKTTELFDEYEPELMDYNLIVHGQDLLRRMRWYQFHESLSKRSKADIY